MKFETEADDGKKMIRQGEIKLIGCQHIFKEIKKDGS